MPFSSGSDCKGLKNGLIRNSSVADSVARDQRPNVLGIELDDNAIADKLGHGRRNPESYDADRGAAVDW
jgi:hypothetical protein